MVDPKASCFSDTYIAYQSPARQLWEEVSSSGHPISQGPLWPPRVPQALAKQALLLVDPQNKKPGGQGQKS